MPSATMCYAWIHYSLRFGLMNTICRHLKLFAILQIVLGTVNAISIKSTVSLDQMGKFISTLFREEPSLFRYFFIC